MAEGKSGNQTWLVTSGRTEGWGRADFGGLHPALEGPTTVTFDERGHVSVELRAERDERGTVIDFDASLWKSLSIDPPVQTPGGVIRSLMPNTAPCTRLEVTTPEGTLTAIEKMRYGIDIRPPRLRFRPLRSVFQTTNPNPTKYWVLPLSNYVSDFIRYFDQHDNHTLRLYPDLATQAGGGAGRAVLGFLYKGAFGFVEPLADYDTLKERLERERNLVTAVMVAEVAGQDIDDLESWFPFNVLRLLGFATGVEVGAPWIEFRDEQGAMVRRIHWRLNTPTNEEGRAAIEERVMYASDDGGIGYLLTQALASPLLATGDMRFVLGAILQAGMWDNIMETSLSLQFRALERLCKYYELSVQDLRAGLTAQQAQDVRDVIRRAEADIRAISRRIPQSNPPTAQELAVVRNLDRVSSRIQNADTRQENALGLSAARLLALPNINLHDADVLDAYFLNNPHPDGNTWSALVTYYRNIIVHEGFFEFTALEEQADRLRTFLEHLQDVLVRVVLQMLVYDGTYQPQTMVRPGKLPVDWVQPGMNASRLGY